MRSPITVLSFAPLCALALIAFLASSASPVAAGPIYTVRATDINSTSTVGLPPDQDPFYTCPEGFSEKPAGAILRQRPISLNFTNSGPAKVKSAQQILYRTVDVFGEPTCTVSTVLQPYNQLRYPTRVLSYQFAEDSPALKCANSYQLLIRGNGTTTRVESILVNLALNKGYVVIMPDYEGPKSGFTVGTIAATGVLDGIRAGLQVGANVIPDPSEAIVSLFGYSGGALASGWAVQQAPIYAPELKIAGAVLGGHIINIKHILLNINNTPHSNLVASGIAGQRNVYPALAEYLSSVFLPNGTAIMDDVNSKCISEIFADGKIYDFFSTLSVSREELFASPQINTALSSGTLGQADTPLPLVPLFVFNSLEDEIIVPKDVDDWVADICNRGASSVTHLRITSGDHETTAATGSPAAFNWLDARFQRLAAPQGCFINNSTAPLLDPLALATVGGVVLSLLNAAVNAPIGPVLGF